MLFSVHLASFVILHFSVRLFNVVCNSSPIAFRIILVFVAVEFLDELDALDERQRLLELLDDSSEDENEIAHRERREYKLMPRINMDKWDDTDFVNRFRLTKPTTAKVLAIIESRLQFYRERYIILLSSIRADFSYMYMCVILQFATHSFHYPIVDCIACVRTWVHAIGHW